MQLCYPHYLSIIEPDRNEKKESSASNTHIVKPNQNDANTSLTSNVQNNIVVRKPLSFGEKITLITKVLYYKQRRENQLLELDPDNFQSMLENAEPLLKGFLDELYKAFIPKDHLPITKKRIKRK